MPSYNTESGDKSVLATKIDSSQTSNIKIASMNINGATTAWANQGGGVIEVIEVTPGTTKREWIYYTGGTENSDSSFTLSGVVRGLARDTSDVTSGGTGQAFSKGAEVRYVLFHDLINKKANLDRANTWSAVQTFGAASSLTPTNTTTPVYHGQRLTTAQRDALTGLVNGDWIYNTTLDQTQWYEGGTWVTNAAGGSVADASTTVAGKVEIATDAEIRTETGAGGTGALTVIPASATAVLKDDRIVLKDATELTIATGAITVTQPYHSVDTQADAASDDLDTINAAVGVGEVIVLVANHTDRSVVVKHNTGNIKTADGSDITLDTTEKSITLLKQSGNWIEVARAVGNSATTYYNKVVYLGASDSAAVGASSTAVNNFDTHTYEIPANDLISGVAYEVEGLVAVSWVANDVVLYIKLGATECANISMTPVGANSEFTFRGVIRGTAAAGAAAAVRTEISGMVGNGTGTGSDYASDYDTDNVATNGALTLQMAFQFAGSNAGHAAVLKSLTVNKISTTAFV